MTGIYHDEIEWFVSFPERLFAALRGEEPGAVRIWGRDGSLQLEQQLPIGVEWLEADHVRVVVNAEDRAYLDVARATIDLPWTLQRVIVAKDMVVCRGTLTIDWRLDFSLSSGSGDTHCEDLFEGPPEDLRRRLQRQT